MNNQPKNKILIIIIGILLIANLATLSFFFLNKGGHKKGDRPDRKEYITSYLKKDVDFSDSQLALFDSLVKKNRTEVRSIFDDMSASRESVFKQLAAQSFSDTAIENAASELSVKQKNVEVRMLQHMKDIRNICTPSQLPAFDSGFYKIIGRKGDSHKKKEKR